MLDLSKIKIDPRTRDWSAKPLAAHMGRPKLLADAVSEYRRLGQNRSCWTYCCTVEHAQNVRDSYKSAGIPAEVITGETSAQRRRELFDAQRQGKIRVLCNVGVLTEGVDFPELGIVQILRPTLSLGLHLQILGRGSRPSRGKTNCIVLDHAGNCARHGFPDQVREWSLEGAKQKERSTRRKMELQTKACPKCKRLVPVQTHKCPSCGYSWQPQTRDGHLIRIQPNTHRVPVLNPFT